MRILSALLCAAVSARADLSFQSTIQLNGGAPVVTTCAIKGARMAILSKRHTSVIDLDTETITEIDFAKKTYSVAPFSQWKKVLEDAAEKSPRETSFQLQVRPAGNAGLKPAGVIDGIETVIDLTGAGGALNITLDTWVETIPGYEQRRDFIDRLAKKLGYTFALGMAEQALQVPEALPGFDEALKRMNQSRGAPVETTIKISSPEKGIAAAIIELGKFGGGAQPVATFNPPDGFKKVDAKSPN